MSGDAINVVVFTLTDVNDGHGDNIVFNPVLQLASPGERIAYAVTAMLDLVRDLARLGWENVRIAKELRMDADAVLRLKQISGLPEISGDGTFSEAWTVGA